LGLKAKFVSQPEKGGGDIYWGKGERVGKRRAPKHDILKFLSYRPLLIDAAPTSKGESGKRNYDREGKKKKGTGKWLVDKWKHFRASYSLFAARREGEACKGRKGESPTELNLWSSYSVRRQSANGGGSEGEGRAKKRRGETVKAIWDCSSLSPTGVKSAIPPS